MDPPTSLLHRDTSIPTTRQSRTRLDGRRTHEEADENPRNLSALPPDRAANIQRMGNIKLARLNLSQRPRRDRQDHHLDYDCHSTSPRNLLLHRTLGVEGYRTEKTPSGRIRRGNLSSSLGIPALPSNHHCDWIHYAEPASNPLIDSGLMLVSVIGAMQTFARKTVNRADRRWSQVLPFLVFAFGSVYAVAQFYFILQGSLTRAGLSIIVNGIVYAVGTLTLMLLLRSHLKIPRSAALVATGALSTEEPSESPPSTEESNVSQIPEAGHESQSADASTESEDDQAAAGVESMEQSDQDNRTDSESKN